MYSNTCRIEKSSNRTHKKKHPKYPKMILCNNCTRPITKDFYLTKSGKIFCHGCWMYERNRALNNAEIYRRTYQQEIQQNRLQLKRIRDGISELVIKISSEENKREELQNQYYIKHCEEELYRLRREEKRVHDIIYRPMPIFYNHEILSAQHFGLEQSLQQYLVEKAKAESLEKQRAAKEAAELAEKKRKELEEQERQRKIKEEEEKRLAPIRAKEAAERAKKEKQEREKQERERRERREQEIREARIRQEQAEREERDKTILTWLVILLIIGGLIALIIIFRKWILLGICIFIVIGIIASNG